MNDQVNGDLYGCSYSDACLEPPDPFIAAGPNDLVQSVNTSLRITNRSGGGAITLDDYAFFGISYADLVSDPRVIYDEQHDRWVADILAADCDYGYIVLAVSETSDPTGYWDTGALAYYGQLPDFPMIGLSSDKISVSYDMFGLSACSFGGYLGTGSSVLDWAMVENGDFHYGYTTPNADYWDWRQATGRDADRDIYGVIGELYSNGWDFDVTDTYGSVYDLTYGGPNPVSYEIDYVGAYAEGLDIVPPEDEDGPLAVDGRVTDAIFQDGLLTWVSTYPCPDASAYDCVRVTQFDVATWSDAQDFLIEGPSQHDAFMGGVGMSTDGHLFIVWSQASYLTAIDTYAVVQDPATGDVSAPELLKAGQGGYGLDRWGDFVGVAPDPSNSAAVWEADEYPTNHHDWATRVIQLKAVTPDSQPPAVTSPVAGIKLGSQLGNRSSTVSWSGYDSQSRISFYDLQRSYGGRSWTYVGLASDWATSTRISLPLSESVRFRVRGTDNAGNTSPWMYGPTFTPVLYDDRRAAVEYSTGWKHASDPSASGGTLTYTSQSGAWARLHFTGRAIAWIAPTSYRRGSADVYVDGRYSGTISLYDGSGHNREVVFAMTWGSVGSHKIKVVVQGTYGHPQVDVDAFLVYQ